MTSLQHGMTAFQYELLAGTATLEADLGGAPSGQQLKDHLMNELDTELHHGRLYPNLDDLTDDGLLDKGTKDKRTNSYGITRRGRQLLSNRRSVLEP